MTTIKKIFLVDNEIDITYALENALENYGYKVDTFNDPLLSLYYYQINFYDLVIHYIKIPKMYRFELYIKIRKKNPKAKICFLTARELFYEEFRSTRLKLGEKIGE